MKIDKFVSFLSGTARSTGHYRKCEVYRSAIHRVRTYCGDVYPSLNEVFSPHFLSDFEEYLLADDLARNTASFYLSVLRTIHRAAVDAGKLPADPSLFASVFTGHVSTQKRALSEETVASLHAADLSDDPRLERCRDLFMVSLCLQGIPFVDLLYLRGSDLQGNLLTYTRRKTGAQVSVYVLDEAKEYLSRLLANSPGTLHLLSVITDRGENGYRQYESALRLYNRQLKELAARLNISETLTSYAARHTWATLAHHNGVEVRLVSQAMGHSTEKTTHTYLCSFGQEHIKGANQAVLNAVLRPIRKGFIPHVREEVRRRLEEEAKDLPDNRRAALEQTSHFVRSDDSVRCEIQAQLTVNPAQPTVNFSLSRTERRRLEKEKRKEEERTKQKKQKNVRLLIQDGH
jgi:integrase